jgi:hypothetical protein
MHLAASTYALWTLTVILEGTLCAVVVHQRLWRRLPLFSIYVLFKFFITIALWLVYKRFGYDSDSALYFYWSTQSLLLVTRASVCVELCLLAFKHRPGLWFHAQRVLNSITAVILVYVVIDAYRHVYFVSKIILSSERGLEFAVAILLASLLLIAKRYRIPIERAPSLIAAGVCLHSAFKVLNDTLLKPWLVPHLPWWNSVQVVSFQVALVIWLLALRRPLPAANPAPSLLPKDTYYSYGRLIGQRLEELDRDIQEVIKP